jgi:aldose 1-epimerase
MTTCRLKNKFFRLEVAPTLGCRWLSCDIKTGGRWAPLLWKAPSFAAARRQPFLYGLYLLAPWCNRLQRSRFVYNGKMYRVRPNLPDGASMHGEVYRHPWTVLKQTSDVFDAKLDSRAVRDFNFPFPLVYRLRIQLRGKNLSAALWVTNPGKSAVPVGLGFHPFFPRPLRWRLRTRAAYAKAGPYPAAKNRALTAEEQRTWVDQEVRPVDRGFTDLKPGAAQLQVGPGRRPVKMRWSPSASDVYVYAPHRHAGRRSAFACIEPMTMRPNFFNDALRLGGRRTRRLAISFSVD